MRNRVPSPGVTLVEPVVRAMSFGTFRTVSALGQECQTALWRPANAKNARTVVTQARRNRADSATNRRLGCVRRNPGSDRRPLAYSRSGRILSDYGNSLDHPIETVGKMDANRIVPDAVIAALR